jgi:hypothetical protein
MYASTRVWQGLCSCLGRTSKAFRFSGSDPNSKNEIPGTAFYKIRKSLKRRLDRKLRLSEFVGHSRDLNDVCAEMYPSKTSRIICYSMSKSCAVLSLT